MVKKPETLILVPETKTNKIWFIWLDFPTFYFKVYKKEPFGSFLYHYFAKAPIGSHGARTIGSAS